MRQLTAFFTPYDDQKRRCRDKRHDKSKAPMLCNSKEGAHSMGFLRQIKVYKKIQAGFF